MSMQCRAENCTQQVETLSLCKRHYNRANKKGLKGPEIEALTPSELLARFGEWEIRSAPVTAPVTAPVAAPVPVAEWEARVRQGNLEAVLVERGRELAKLQAALTRAETRVRELEGDVEALLMAPTPVPTPVPAPTHGELLVVQVDMDSQSRLRVTLRGEGCRDVAHLVGRKIRVSRLSET